MDAHERAQMSRDYVLLDSYAAAEKAAERLSGAWASEQLVSLHEEAVADAFDSYYKGEPTKPFDVLVTLLKGCNLRWYQRLLDVGCSLGHYADVLRHADIPVLYAGVDSSAALIRRARQLRPYSFQVMDATHLMVPPDTFDIVISSGCIPCIFRWDTAIRELVRVAHTWILLHRNPLVKQGPTAYYTKKAYNIETLEVRFEEAALRAVWESAGAHQYAQADFEDANSAVPMRTYLLKKGLDA